MLNTKRKCIMNYVRIITVLLVIGALDFLTASDNAPVKFIGYMNSFAASPTFSTYWYQDQNGNWKIKDGNGRTISNAWLCDDAIPENGQNVWYLLGADGNMITAGLIQDGTGNYYSLETEHNGYYGMLRYQSGSYDGVSLQLESRHEGNFARILNADAIEALRGKYNGVMKVDIDNSNCVYTSQIKSTNFSAKNNSTVGGGGSGSSGGSFGSSSSGSSSNGKNNFTEKNVKEEQSKKQEKIIVEENVSENESKETTLSNESSESTPTEGNTLNKSIYDAYKKREEELKVVIEQFKKEHISDDMTDFEKEMEIVKYIMENVTYDYSLSNDYIYSSYGALVNHLAVCGGYADAFIDLAEACGLEAVVVTGDSRKMDHAWNRVKIDGSYYNLDLTWEDNESERNAYFYYAGYINLSDEIFKRDHTWDEKKYAATNPSSDKYSSSVVGYYLTEGVVDLDMKGDKWRDYVSKTFPDWYADGVHPIDIYGPKYDDGQNYFSDPSDEDAILNYIYNKMKDGFKYVYVTIPKGESLKWLSYATLQEHLGGGKNYWFYEKRTSYKDLKYETYFITYNRFDSSNASSLDFSLMEESEEIE